MNSHDLYALCALALIPGIAFIGLVLALWSTESSWSH